MLHGKTVFFALMLWMATEAQSKDEVETLKETIEVLVITIKDAVSDTTDTVRRSAHVGAEAAREYLASASARIKIALQEARAKHAQQKAKIARQERFRAERELAETQKQLRIARATLAALHKAHHTLQNR